MSKCHSRGIFMKATAVLVLLACMVSLMGGCSGSGSQGSGGKATLNVWVRSRYYSLMSEAAKSYNASNPKVKIVVTQPSDMSDNLALAISSHKTPDIVSMDCVLIPYYSSIGAMEDITDKFNSLSYKDKFSGGLLDLSKYNKRQYAVPFAPDLSVLLWNKDIFKASGLDPEKAPTSWDELTKDAQACTNKDHYGYVFGAADAGTMMFTFGPYIWSNGGDFTNKDGSKSMLDQPKAVESLQYIVDLVHKYKVTPSSITSYGWTEAEDAFKSGKSAMVVLGTDAVGAIVNKKYSFNAGCALIPAADGKTYSSFSGGDSIGIMANTKNKDAAWDFIQYCLSKNYQVDKLAASGFVPSRLDYFNNSYFSSHTEYQVLQQALKVGKAPYSTKYNEMYKPFVDAIQYAINGQKTSKQAFEDAAKQINDILATKN